MAHTFTINAETGHQEFTVEADAYTHKDGYFHFGVTDAYGTDTVFTITAASVVTIRRS